MIKVRLFLVTFIVTKHHHYHHHRGRYDLKIYFKVFICYIYSDTAQLLSENK